MCYLCSGVSLEKKNDVEQGNKWHVNKLTVIVVISRSWLHHWAATSELCVLIGYFRGRDGLIYLTGSELPSLFS